jgi:hypothetical protein
LNSALYCFWWAWAALGFDDHFFIAIWAGVGFPYKGCEGNERTWILEADFFIVVWVI